MSTRMADPIEYTWSSYYTTPVLSPWIAEQEGIWREVGGLFLTALHNEDNRTSIHANRHLRCTLGFTLSFSVFRDQFGRSDRGCLSDRLFHLFWPLSTIAGPHRWVYSLFLRHAVSQKIVVYVHCILTCSGQSFPC